MLQSKTLSRVNPQYWLKAELIAIAGSALIALCAQIAIPLPFTPIPMTMQTIAILLLGAVFGPRIGALCVINYLIEATCGLPVLANGMSNPLWFCGPRAGYLIGFVVAAYLIGKLMEKIKTPTISKLFGALFLCQATILFCGWAALSFFMGPKGAFFAGVLPFVIADSVKTGSLTLILLGIMGLKRKVTT